MNTRSSVKSLLRILLCISLSLFCSCNFFGLLKRGATDEKVATQPVPISGSNIAIFTYEKGRVRCGWDKKASDIYSVLCRAVIVNDDGNEVAADIVSPELTLSWKLPAPLDGSTPGIRCDVSAQQLSQECTVTLNNSQSSKLQVDLEISSYQKPSKTESDVVDLTYTIVTYGQALDLLNLNPLVNPLVAQPSSSKVSYEGISNPKKNPFDFPLFPNSVCVNKTGIFFSSAGTIVQFDNDGVSLFAGAPQGRSDDLSHRLRTRIGNLLKLVCGEDFLLVSDRDLNRILRMDYDGSVKLIAGTWNAPLLGDGGPATAASLKYPEGIAQASDGSIYVADSGNARIRKISKDGIITTVATVSGQPYGLVLSSDGTIYFSDKFQNNIGRIDSAGNVFAVAGTTNVPGSSGDNGPALAALLSRPTTLQFSKEGELVFTDFGNQRIRAISKSGIIRTIAGTGVAGFTGDDGPATNAKLFSPDGLAVGSDGTLYFADTVNYRLRKIAGGIISTIAGSDNPDLGDNGPAQEARYKHLRGLAYGNDGSIIVADRVAHRIRRISPESANGPSIVEVVAGTGSPGSLSQPNGDGGLAKNAVVGNPIGVAVDSEGNIYFADGEISRVRKIDTSGGITTVVGGGTASISASGIPVSDARLNGPTDVAFGPDGLLYIADTASNCIRRVNADQTVTTYAGICYAQIGDAPEEYNGDEIPATTAYLSRPSRIAFGSDNQLVIVDSGYSRLRRVDGNGIIHSLLVKVPGASTPSAEALWSVSDLKPYLNGFVAASGFFGRVYQLVPATDPSYDYDAKELFGGSGRPKDCVGGVIKGKTNSKDIDASLRASLSSICPGSMSALAVRNACNRPEKTISLAFSQIVNGSILTGPTTLSTIVTIVRPCP